MYQRIVRFGFTAIFILIAFSSSINTSLAQEGAKPPFKIIQLGDSYSAGNGARSETGSRNYSGVEGCYRSPTNWGSQFARSLGDVFAVTYINRACSGGVTRDILNPRVMDYPKMKSDGSCPFPEYPDEEEINIDEEDPTRCKRILKPQINAIDASVDLVIMTMGGNDVQFDNLVRQCYLLRDRSEAECREAVGFANSELEKVRGRLINDIFGQLRSRLRPDAKVAFSAYPYLTLNVTYELNDDESTEFYNVTEAVRSLGLQGDAEQRSAIEAANAAAGEDYIVFYDGTKALFEGHEPDPAFHRSNPNGWLHEFVLPPYANVDSYHPNSLGHENWARALSAFETFGAVGGSFGTNADLDVVFVVDTTGSMGDEIAQVRTDLSRLVAQLSATTDSYRVAVVSYRDFPQRTGSGGDYPSRVDQTFTHDLAEIQGAIDSLTANGGGDAPETVFSGIQAALELPWRPGITKIAIVIGDAPALSPEPISNLTSQQIVANSIAIDPVRVIGVNTGSLNSNGALGQIADGTGGSIVQGTSGLTTKISEIFDSAAKQPFAWIGQAYSGKIGQPIQFDASGSYDPSGLQITLYEWDFDGDGAFDVETTEPTASHVYSEGFNDYVVLRVTGKGGTALASARTVANTEGFASQGDETPCKLDEEGYSIIVDENGQFIRCAPDSLPMADKEGLIVIEGTSSTSDLSITKTASPNPVVAKQNLTYALSVINNGPDAAIGVKVVDTLPAEVSFVSATASQGNCTQASGTVTCDIGNMANGATATVTIVATANSGPTISNTANVSGNEADPDTTNNSANAVATVSTLSGKGMITIVKDTQPDSAQDFAYYGPFGKFYLDDAAPNDGDSVPNSVTYTVNPGTYNFAEGVFQSWYLADIQCVGTGQSTNDLVIKRSVSITVKAGDVMTCTFVTQRRVKLEAIKFNDMNGDAIRQPGEPTLTPWEFRFYKSDGTLINHKVTDANGSAVQNNVIPGSFKVCEVPKTGWTNTLPGRIDAVLGLPCYELTLQPGQDASLLFGNTQGSVAVSAQEIEPSSGITVGELPDINEPESGVIYLPLINR